MDDRDQAMGAKDRGQGVTRRVAVQHVGGGLALAAAALAGGRVALAETAATPAMEATPTGGVTGLYAAVRRYQLAPGKSMDELVHLVETGFVPIVQSVPGFVEYTLIVDDATGAQTSVSVFRDSASADESTQKAASWVAANVANFNVGPPAVMTGTIRVHAAAGAPAS